MRTVRYSPRNQTEQRAARWTGGRSAACPRTVRGAHADSPRGPGGHSARLNGHSCQPLTSRFLSLEFKHGQSGRASRTIREVRVFPITASNGKGEHKYSKPGVGEYRLAL
jgi:hypothetical protein